MIERLRQIKRSITALRIASGSAVRVFCKVYHVAKTCNLQPGDRFNAAYVLEIK